MNPMERRPNGARPKYIGRSLMSAFQQARGLMRSITGIVLFFFLWSNVQPAVAAITEEIKRPTPSKVEAGKDDAHARLTDTLESKLLALQGQVKSQRDRIIKTKRKDAKTGKEILDITIIGTPDERPIKDQQAGLKKLAQAFEDQEQETLDQFKADKAHLDKYKLPQIIHDRHAEAVKEFKAKAKEVQDDLDQLSNTKTVLALHDRSQALLDKIKTWRPKHHKLDPNNLPFRTPDEKVREPLTNPEALQKMLKGEPVAANPIPLAQRKAEISETELALINADEHPYTLDRGSIRVAGPGAPIPPPGPEFLAETEDVQITDAIRAKAAELHNNPVEIYNWVYNNIEFLPTYGSIQGSQLTLDKKAGNAFDTSSLLIALLRAANIPARYVYGTVDIPLDKAMNWVGGVTAGDAAQQLLGQGGIPNVGLTKGGQFFAIRMEHVWVEAWVDFYPSRGAKNRTPDTWAPLDGSFKQYSYTAGVNLQQHVPFDFDDLVQAAAQDATVDESQGWVQNLSDATILSRLDEYQQQLLTYIDQQQPGATADDVLGMKTIQLRKSDTLAANLPYRTIIAGTRLGSLPESLRWKITLNLYASAADMAYQSALLTVPLSLTSLGTKRLAAVYIPASEEDVQTIESYADQDELPVYQIKQTLKIQLDEQTLAELGPQGMGSDQYWSYTLTTAGGGSLEEDFKLISVVGDQVVFGIDGGGLSEQQAASRYHLVNPNSPLENLQQLSLGYWARADVSDRMLAASKGVAAYRMPSVGMFSQPLSVIYAWGMPRLGSYKSYAIDIRRLSVAAVMHDGNSAADFVFHSGLKNSYLEGRVFEEVFDYAPGNGFSAVAVLNQAINDGVPIWRVDANNLSAYLAASILPDDLKSQITNAVNAGSFVIASEAGVDVGFWRGDGYIAVDPETGAGAFILKGANGGELIDCERQSMPLAKSLAEQILTWSAIAIATLLIAGAIGGSGGLAAPAIVTAMRAVGITVLTFSVPARAGECPTENCHRGSIQAQGDDIFVVVPGQRTHHTQSVHWAQPTPLTRQQGLNLLEALKAKLTPAQLAAREEYFAEAAEFIERSAAAGGRCAGPPRSFGPNPNIKDHVKKQIRVDIVINMGQAFTP